MRQATRPESRRPRQAVPATDVSRTPSTRATLRSPWPRRVIWALLLLVLAAGAAFNLSVALALIGRADETRYGEAILYDHAARLLRGEPLYQPLDGPPYTIATYTPLYYWLAAGLRLLFGPGFLLGRLVSLVSGVAVAALVSLAAWRRARSAWPALLASVAFLAFGLGGTVPWSAAYKEDLLGVALAVASVVLLDCAGGPRGVLAAAVLAAAALLTKQSLLGPAVFGTLWLLVLGHRRWAALYSGTVTLLVVAVLGGLQLLGHNAVWDNVVAGNLHQPFDSVTFDYNLRQLAIFLSAPLLLALAYAMSRPRDALVFGWLGAFGPVLAIGAIGGDTNYWLQLAAMSSLLAALWLWRTRAHWLSMAGSLALAATAIIATYGTAAWLQARPTFLANGSAEQAAFQGLVRRVSATPGTVLADPMDVLVLADRPILLEPIVFALREQDHSWDAAPLVERICRGEVQLLVLGYPPDELGQRFPSSVAQALQQTMRLEDTISVGSASRWILEPHGSCFT